MSDSEGCREFTDQERLKILLFLVGEYELCNIPKYETYNSVTFESDDPRDALLSDILGFDFQEVIYENEEHKKNSRNKFVKQYLKEEGHKSWFIGDVFFDILFDVVSECVNLGVFPSQTDLEELSSRVIALWRDYNIQLEKESDYEYEKAMVVDGEQLYRRLDK